MESSILEALKLMIVGMGTVCAVLLLVIGASNALIAFVNRFCPEEEVKPASKPADKVDDNVAAAIAMAIANVTGGKAKVEKIEKL